MIIPLIALIIFIIIAVISGTIKTPTGDDITLLIAASSLLVIAWFKKREKKDDVDQEGHEAFSAVHDENKGK